jgi:PqqD family protein of HPr-rel-A system
MRDTSQPPEARYAVDSLVQLHWASWDDEYVVFDEYSGQTHQLDALRAYVLHTLSDAPKSVDMLTAEIGDVALHYGESLHETLVSILNEFQATGLVEPEN